MSIEIFNFVLLLWLTLLTGMGLGSFLLAWTTHHRYLEIREEDTPPTRSRVLVQRGSNSMADMLINRGVDPYSAIESPSLLKSSPLRASAASYSLGSRAKRH
jgi:hypothetical protein